MKKSILTLLIAVSTMLGYSQCDSLAGICEKHITKNYITDGQAYRALLNGTEVAEFKTTLFGGNTYRIAACSGTDDGNLVFKIYDQEKNLLFSSVEFSNTPYWDFVIENTMVVTIEANLDNTRSSSGCAVVIIGFKR
ncbi:MAG: hypothetical protein ACOVMR_10865 [Flavobacteriales bacterium]|jgi:hypothetical protein